MSVHPFRSRFTPPPTYGEPCRCDECLRAGATDLRPVRTPAGELHGVALRRHVEAKAKFDAAVQALADSRRMR